MATISAETHRAQTAQGVWFSREYYWVDCATTFANFGPAPNTTAPAACQSTPLFSEIEVDSIPFSDCSDPVAYKSCMPSPSLALQYAADFQNECNKTYTYHSPALSCPPGWTEGGQYTLKPTGPKSNGGASYVSTSYKESLVPWGAYPSVAGTHRLCCPSSYNLIGGSAYSCQSIRSATATPEAISTTYCAHSWTNTNGALWSTDTTSLTALPSAPATYKVEAVLVIGTEPTFADSHRGLTRKDIGLAVVFSTIGLALLIACLVLIRRRHLKRLREEQKGLRPKYKHQRPPVWNDAIHGYAVQNYPQSYNLSRRSASGAASREGPESERPEYGLSEVPRRHDWVRASPEAVPPLRTLRMAHSRPGMRDSSGESISPVNRRPSSSFDLPPAYHSSEVWEGDGRPPRYET